MQLSGLQLLGKMGRFERPFRLAPTSAGSRARARCSLGMTCVCRGPEPALRALHRGSGQDRHPWLPSCVVTCVYRIPSKQGNCSACRDEQPEDQAAKPPFFPWTPILTCCRPFTQIPWPAAVAFSPISFLFCFILWQRPRWCRALDTSIARFCWLST